MSTVFVNSGAAGANNGTSWTDAYTSLASTNGAAAGDIIKVHKAHSQTTLAANITWSNGTLSNPVRIWCVDKDNSDALSTGAIVGWNTGSLGPQGNIVSYGISWRSSGTSLVPTAGTNSQQIFESCGFVLAGTTDFAPSSGTRGKQIFRECTLDFSGAGAATVAFLTSSLRELHWIGGEVIFRATHNRFMRDSSANGLAYIFFEGVKFTGTVTDVIDHSASTSQAQNRIFFRGCQAPSFTNLINTTQSHYYNRVDAEGFVAGTITVPIVPTTNITQYAGTVKSSLSRYRTSGADDGSQANAYSWELASNSNAAAQVASLVTPSITRWVGTGSQVIKVYIASGGTLNDDECWIEVLSPSEAVSATAQAKFRSTRCAPLATPAALATDGSSTWNGAGVGTKQYVPVTIAPTVAGPVTVRVHFAKASTTAYVDPVIELAGDATGKSRFAEGVQAFDFTDAGGGTTVIVVEDD